MNTNVDGNDGRTYQLSTSAGSSADNGGLSDVISSSLSGYNCYADKYRQTIFASATKLQHNHFMKQCIYEMDVQF